MFHSGSGSSDLARKLGSGVFFKSTDPVKKKPLPWYRDRPALWVHGLAGVTRAAVQDYVVDALISDHILQQIHRPGSKEVER